MSKKKHVATIEEDVSPTALIVGGGSFGGYLLRLLEERGCKACFDNNSSPLSSRKFDYIFQFDQTEKVSQIKDSHLKAGGKFLFIKTNEETESDEDSSPSVKTLHTGPLDLWNQNELGEKILKAMFSLSSQKIDVRKKPVSSPPPVKQVLKEVDKKEVVNVFKPIHKNISEKPKKAAAGLEVRVEVKRRFVFWISLFVILPLVMISGLTYGYVKSLQTTFDNFRTHFASSSWGLLSQDVNEARNKFALANLIYEKIYLFIPAFRETSFMKNTGEVLNLSGSLFETADKAISLFQRLKIAGKDLPTEGIEMSDVKKTEEIVESLRSTMLLLGEKLTTLSLPFLPKETFNPFLVSSIDKLNSVGEVLPLISDLFLNESTKTYLLLFQNNMELRPTGGFIGSFALLTVAKGKIIDFKIMDVYTADGQLKGHVEPPLPIRKYLSQPNWFLRDSNFDPDFSLSGRQAAWFLEKELGIKADGVIGINLFFLQNVLRAVGDLSLPDFKDEIVNADNFFFKAHFFAQQNFFPGSTQKKDFLTSVAKTLQTKIAVSDLPLFDLFLAVKQGLEEKNVLLFLAEEELQKKIENKGWAGRMIEVNCSAKNDLSSVPVLPEQKNCFPDYLSIVEANLGVNKANYFIDKSITVEKSIKDGFLTTGVTVAYENRGMTEGLVAGGIYTNYLRFFVPKESRLVSVSLNSVQIPSSEIDVSETSDKSVFGFLVRIASGNKGIIKAIFTSSRVIADLKSYQFFYQKQGGDKNSPLIISFANSESFNFLPANFQSTAGSNKEIFYTTDTSVDRVFALVRK